jgi:hypothetical protein
MIVIENLFNEINKASYDLYQLKLAWLWIVNFQKPSDHTRLHKESNSYKLAYPAAHHSSLQNNKLIKEPYN